MSVVDDIQGRISAISQLFPAMASGGVGVGLAASASASTSTQTFGSELESAMASVSSIDEGTALSSGGSAGAGGVTGNAIVADAGKYLGVPYVYGGTDPNKGLDCSALVQRTYADLGVSLPRTSQEQATMGTPVASLADARPGDLVCFGSPAEHIGIYVGDGKMINAPHTGTNVRIEQITQTPSTIRRIVATPASSVESPISARPAALSSAYPSGKSAYTAQFSAAERKYGLPGGLLSAVAHAESGYRPDAVSSAGAIGLMQLMPDTAKSLGVDPADPAQAIDGAARLLKGELTKYGSVPLALAAYNAGGPAVDRYGGIPPYPETQQYVQKVLTYYSEGA